MLAARGALTKLLSNAIRERWTFFYMLVIRCWVNLEDGGDTDTFQQVSAGDLC
jgi:hypothetical protein